MQIRDNCMVSLRYRIQSESGEALPYPEGPFRMEVLIGHDRLLPALEDAIRGHEEGDRVKALLPPEAVFGRADENGITSIAMSDIVDPGSLEVGDIHHVMDEDSALRPFKILEIHEGRVIADFNHPLADRSLIFQIEIDRVRWATMEELRKALSP